MLNDLQFGKHYPETRQLKIETMLGETYESRRRSEMMAWDVWFITRGK